MNVQKKLYESLVLKKTQMYIVYPPQDLVVVVMYVVGDEAVVEVLDTHMVNYVTGQITGINIINPVLVLNKVESVNVVGSVTTINIVQPLKKFAVCVERSDISAQFVAHQPIWWKNGMPVLRMSTMRI